jgi:hypothetical protein
MNAVEVARRITKLGMAATLTHLSAFSRKTEFSVIRTLTRGIIGEDLANFVKGVWKANPDFSIEMLNNGEIEPGVVAHHWIIRGTNTGPGRDGSEPTGRKLTFKGASIVHVEGDKIRSDYAYFDRKAIDEQFE